MNDPNSTSEGVNLAVGSSSASPYPRESSNTGGASANAAGEDGIDAAFEDLSMDAALGRSSSQYLDWLAHMLTFLDPTRCHLNVARRSGNRCLSLYRIYTPLLSGRDHL